MVIAAFFAAATAALNRTLAFARLTALNRTGFTATAPAAGALNSRRAGSTAAGTLNSWCAFFATTAAALNRAFAGLTALKCTGLITTAPVVGSLNSRCTGSTVAGTLNSRCAFSATTGSTAALAPLYCRLAILPAALHVC